MTNNRKIANSILKHLRDNGLTPVDVQFGNGYFSFLFEDMFEEPSWSNPESRNWCEHLMWKR